MQNFESLATSVADLTNTIARIAKDGKFKWTESFLLVPHLKDLSNISARLEAAAAELTDWRKNGADPLPLASIQAEIIARIDLDSDKAEQAVELILNLAVALTANTSALVQLFRDDTV